MTDDLSNTWMWERARDLIDQADKLQQQFNRRGNSGSWLPPIDLFETKTEIWILVAIPGIKEDDLSIGFDGVTVTISGVRHLPEPFREAVIHRLEIPNGRFERRIPLPAECSAVTRNQISNGCLLVGLRKV